MRVARGLVLSLSQPTVDGPPTPHTAPRVPIADLRSGTLAKVIGTVRCFDEPVMLAPLCGRRCAYYRTKLYEATEQRALQESGSQSFYIEDDTGELLVLVDEPDVSLTMDVKVSWGMLDPLTDSAKRFLERHERASHDGVLRRDIRFEEGLIEVGESIAVYGSIRPARGVAARFAGYRSGHARLLVEAPDGDRLRISDVKM